MSTKPKRVFITNDMEGTTGVVDWSQVGSDQLEYEKYRKLMVGDLNAAIEGALASGVKEITISDSHGKMKNLHPWEVNEAATLIRGSPKPFSMMAGISDEFDAALFVGYHARRGTPNAVLCHTYTLGVIAVYINGIELGEFGINAALAGHYGVPSIFISGDAAVATEAKALIPEIKTAALKKGMGRYAAECIHPDKTGPIIRKMVSEALISYEEIEPFRLETPVKLQVELVSATSADAASILPYIERLDGRTVAAVFDDYPTAYRGLNGIFYLASGAERR
ncbi:MAG: M55 family metallopeptidase [Candidatus Bathyarchaeota archaeon]|nr:M55 family metallopeptidase [Candidatus Bathyarchaeota archaeon]